MRPLRLEFRARMVYEPWRPFKMVKLGSMMLKNPTRVRKTQSSSNARSLFTAGARRVRTCAYCEILHRYFMHAPVVNIVLPLNNKAMLTPLNLYSPEETRDSPSRSLEHCWL